MLVVSSESAAGPPGQGTMAPQLHARGRCSRVTPSTRTRSSLMPTLSLAVTVTDPPRRCQVPSRVPPVIPTDGALVSTISITMFDALADPWIPLLFVQFGETRHHTCTVRSSLFTASADIVYDLLPPEHVAPGHISSVS